MKEVLHALCGLAFGLCLLLATRFWLISALYSFRAAANRRPGVGWHRAMRAIILGEEVYTQTAKI